MENQQIDSEDDSSVDIILQNLESIQLNRPNRQNQDRQGRNENVQASPCRQRVPTNEDCESVVNYFKLTMQIIKEAHKDHIGKVELMKPFPEIVNGDEVLNLPRGVIPPIYTSYQEYIFNCPLCYDQFTQMHSELSAGGSSTPSVEREPQPGTSSDYRHDAGTSDGSLEDTVESTSSLILQMLSASQQYIFDCANTPLSLDPNTPSTSTFFSFYETAQLLSMEVGFIATPIRVKKYSKKPKDTGYQRPESKEEERN